MKKRKKDDIIKLQKHIKIAPKFLVFYNGKSKMEDSHVEYLSAAFENLTGEPDLELKVLILNINEGHNRELMEQCKALKQYAKYVARVREYVEEIGLDAAVSRAVKECIREGILDEFLRQNRAEVEKVSIFEYNKEEEERKLRVAEYEGGWEAGKQAGMEAGMQVAAQMVKEFHLEKEEVIKFLQNNLDIDEKAAKEMLEEE